MMKKVMLATVAAITSVGSAQAATSLSCASTGTRSYTTCSSTASAYTDGAEFYYLNSSNTKILSFDFTGDNLVISNVFSRGFEQASSSGTIQFDFKSFSNPFTDATLTSASSELTQSAITLKDNLLSVRVEGIQWNYGSSATIRLYQPLAAAVPEPATWAMMILGFGVVGFAMRRGRPRANAWQA